MVGLARRELASSLLAVASLPSSLTPTPPIGLLPPTVTFGVQIYDDATAERLTLQDTMRHAHAMPCTRHVDPGAPQALQALAAGFRSFFTSPEGGNQLGFARAIARSGLPREQLYIAGTVLSDVSVGERPARRATLSKVASWPLGGATAHSRPGANSPGSWLHYALGTSC